MPGALVTMSGTPAPVGSRARPKVRTVLRLGFMSWIGHLVAGIGPTVPLRRLVLDAWLAADDLVAGLHDGDVELLEVAGIAGGDGLRPPWNLLRSLDRTPARPCQVAAEERWVRYVLKNTPGTTAGLPGTAVGVVLALTPVNPKTVSAASPGSRL